MSRKSLTRRHVVVVDGRREEFDGSGAWCRAEQRERQLLAAGKSCERFSEEYRSGAWRRIEQQVAA